MNCLSSNTLVLMCHYGASLAPSHPCIILATLQAQRQEFWDTQPAYGGSPEIWSVLKAMCEAPDIDTGKLFLEAAEVTIGKPDMTAFYDSRGFLYELPNYIVSDPRDWK